MQPGTNDPFAQAVQAMIGGTDAMGAELSPDELVDEDIIDRNPDAPEDPSRRSLVMHMQEQVRADRDYWEDLAFKRMRADQKFAAGQQWPSHPVYDAFIDEAQQRYVANVVLRHIHSRTASIYGKNPKTVARRRERILNTVWDGRLQSIQDAMMTVQSGMPDPYALAVLTDAQKVLVANQTLDKVGKTLELLYQHEVDEQTIPFKVQMKAMIRRALTTGVGYVKLGYQRIMDRTPEINQRIADASEKLARVEQLSADIADEQVDPHAPEIEQLRLLVNDLSNEQDIIVREGLVFSYPDSTSIIPARGCRQIRGWVGCDRVTEEYYLSREEIEQFYKVDVKTKGKAYRAKYKGANEYEVLDVGGAEDPQKEEKFCVWEIYNKADGLVYLVCDGYPEFLTEPAAPDVYLERFFPWFPFVVNEVYDDKCVIPPSDVRLLMDMQLELNRARQGLREHRRANRPRTYTRSGALSEQDKTNLETAKANAVVELQGLAPGEKIDDVLQSARPPGIDPALYDTTPAFEDVLRVVGAQEANLGGTSGATATESSIAEGSRMSSVSSTIDDLDEFLTELSRAAGQILLLETSVETVRQVVGPGAVWPDLRREEVAKEIYLEIEAASTGRPNRAAETQTAQQVYPLLMQIPGLSPEWLARELLRRMDDRLDLTDAFAAGMPSIQSLNRMGQMTGAQPGQDPNAQGGEGSGNAPDTKPNQVNAAPRPDAPRAGPGRPPMDPTNARMNG